MPVVLEKALLVNLFSVQYPVPNPLEVRWDDDDDDEMMMMMMMMEIAGLGSIILGQSVSLISLKSPLYTDI